MKLRLESKIAATASCVLLVMTFASSTAAQILPPGTSPLVTIVALDAQASEEGPDKGAFALRRSGPADVHLMVYFSLSGTASSGLDYEPISRTALMAPGEWQVTVGVVPIDDSLVEGMETVVARVVAPLTLNTPVDQQYSIINTNFAVVAIADNDRPLETNRPPVVQILTPENGAAFPRGEPIHLAAHAGDVDGYVSTVEFFAGTNRLGITTNNPLSMSPANPFQLVWSNAPAGPHLLVAQATDDDGATSLSSPVRITVGDINVPAIVTVIASDPNGAEIPEVPPGMERPQLIDPAVFTLTRSGNTNVELRVHYVLGGSASNGVDYAKLSGEAIIPAGVTRLPIEVLPLDDLLVEETESVTLTVLPPVCIAIFPPPPECYQVGTANRATAFIHDNDSKETNYPPFVRITSPLSGAGFPADADIPIRAVTVDPDGYANVVEFFEGTRKIGEAAIHFIQAPPPGEPIHLEFTWQDVPAGTYVLTARTVDDQGTPGVSAPVHITVGGTNRPPAVSIVARDAFAVEGTNHGLNTATFLVQRTGGTNTPLTVPYRVGGSASNGVDYLPISSSVTLSPGQSSAPITIVPIDDLLVEKSETVLLSLIPAPLETSATNPPPYVIGFPSRAAAAIVDNDLFYRPPSICYPDRFFHLCLPATNGHCFRVEASTNLIHWVPLCTNRVVEGAVHFVDPDAPQFPGRFYRTIPESPLAVSQ